MFDLPDVATLRQCSILCSAAYAAVFFAMAAGRPWYLCWGWGSFSYLASLVTDGLVGEPFPLWAQVLSDGVLCFSMALVLAGVRRFDGRRGFAPWMWATVAAMAIVPSAAVAVFDTGAIASAIWAAAMAICSFCFAAPLLFCRMNDGTARARRIAGWLLALYVPVYLSVAVSELLTPQLARLLDAVPYLADQLLFGAANLALLWIPASHSQARLREMALRDPLTGAWNRAALAANAAGLLVPGRVVLLVDVDRFKAINDVHGHATGDRVLTAVTAALQRHADGGFVARMGGDEFVVVTGADDPAATARHLAICASAGAPDLPPWTLSIGSARIEPDDRSIDAVIQRADLSMYRAKRRGCAPVAA